MTSRSGYRFIKYLAPLAIASAIGCGGAGPEGGLGETSQAATTGGMTASLSITSKTTTTWSGTLTVTNGGATLASNWQVGLAMGSDAITNPPSSVEVFAINGLSVVSPTNSNATLNPGASLNVSLSGTMPSGGNPPTVSTVDGDAPGTVGNTALGWPSDGIDHVAQAAATGALDVAIAYQNNKPANNGDSLYGFYDNLIWSAHAYSISGGKMIFDPNAPGYKYVSQAAQSALSDMQDAPEVAAYLTSGLASCFKDTNSGWVYSFRSAVLKGYKNGATWSGTLAGQKVPDQNWAPGGYNPASIVNNFTASGIQNGGLKVSVTLTSPPVKSGGAEDYWFGLLTYTSFDQYTGYSATTSKFNSQAQLAACSPFNGPGGSANPYFAIALNGSNVAARFQGVGAECGGQVSACTSTMVLDPVPYAQPGAYYDATGTLVGTQANPFALSPTVLYAVPDHASQWATRTLAGTQHWGTFTNAITILGNTEYQYVQQM